MKNVFYEEVAGIYRLKVPFENIYTSVFLIKAEDGDILVDCATTDQDVDEHIAPALQQLGTDISKVKKIVITHKHGDHAGGLERVLQLSPNIEVVKSVVALDKNLSTYAMAGHTVDCIGVLDMRTHTLISGDGLQGAGVDKYRCYLRDSSAYLETINRVKNDERIENILFSHAYEPWNCDTAYGRATVDMCLSECLKYI
jgi:glyoxylase-like metal-dependent hydrolase (beta-lactamase superfamily II)